MPIVASDVLEYIQDHGYGTDTSAAQLRAVNAAVQRVWNFRRWPWTYTLGTYGTVAGTETVDPALLTALEPNRVRLRSASSPDYYDLEHLEPEEFFTLSRSASISGSPTYWTYFSELIYLYPKPDAIYQLQVTIPRSPVRATDPTDEFQIPDAFLEIIGLFAVSEIAFRERDRESRDAVQNEAYQRMREISAEAGLPNHKSEVSQSSGFYDAYDGPVGIM